MAAIGSILYFGLIILMIVSEWKIFEKANQPGWAILIPFYNIYIFLKIINKPGWWMLLLLIPFFPFYLYHLLAKSFEKDAGFTLGLIFLPFIFIPILGLGDAQYQGEGVVNDNEMLLDSNL